MGVLLGSGSRQPDYSSLACAVSRIARRAKLAKRARSRNLSILIITKTCCIMGGGNTYNAPTRHGSELRP